MANINLPTKYPDGITEDMLPNIVLFHCPHGQEKY
jgi:hypothetical protein